MSMEKEVKKNVSLNKNMHTVMQLEEYAEIINGGSWSEDEYTSSGLKVIKVTNMVNGTINDDSISFIPLSSFHKYKKHLLHTNDLVIATVGSHPDQQSSVVGRTAIIPRRLEGALLNQNAACIRIASTSKVNKIFFKYITQTSLFKYHIESRARGSANQVRLAISELKKFHFSFPPLPIQRKIAAILSAYDELIENNNRRIAILEKMAEEIYKEWFVRFRFPGHEKVKIVNGIPEGWEVKKVKDIVDRKPFGNIYKESELKEIGVTIVIDQSHRDLLGFHDNKPDHIATIDSPIILFGDHSCKMLLMIEPFSLAENVVPFKSLNCDILYLYYSIYKLLETTEYKRHWTELTNKEIIVPSDKLQNDFSKYLQSILYIKQKFLKSTNNLKRTRDLLLPRLISGKLDVENLDIAIPEGMGE